MASSVRMLSYNDWTEVVRYSYMAQRVMSLHFRLAQCLKHQLTCRLCCYRVISCKPRARTGIEKCFLHPKGKNYAGLKLLKVTNRPLENIKLNYHH